MKYYMSCDGVKIRKEGSRYHIHIDNGFLTPNLWYILNGIPFFGTIILLMWFGVPKLRKGKVVYNSEKK